LPEQLRITTLPALVAATEGFTGADLKRLVEDGKAIYAHDLAKQADLKPPMDYFLMAVDGVRENKQRYAQAEAHAALTPKLPFKGFPSFLMSSQLFPEGG
jgi:transitional endoplasmic reticulum ATPase